MTTTTLRLKNGLVIAREAFADVSFRVRVFIVSALTTLVVAGAVVWIGVRTFEEDRISYVFETHTMGTSVLRESVRAFLSESKLMYQDGARSSEPPSTLFLGQWRLPRLPEPGDTFVAETKVGNRDFRLVWRTPSGETRTAPLDIARLAEHLAGSAEARHYVVTQDGALVWTNSRARTTAFQEVMFDAVFSSRMGEGNTVVPWGKGRIAIGHREVPGTNLIVVQQTPLTGLLRPLKAALRLWVLMALPIFGLGIIIQMFVLEGLSGPLRQCLGAFQNIIHGNYAAKVPVGVGEFKQMLAGAQLLQLAVAHREERLQRFANALRGALEAAQGTGGDAVEALQGLTKVLARHAVPPGNIPPLVLVKEQVWKGWLSSGEGWETFDVPIEFTSEGAEKFSLGECDASDVGLSFFPRELPTLRIPVWHEKTMVALVCVGTTLAREFPEIWDLAPVFGATAESFYLRRGMLEAASRHAAVSQELAIARDLQRSTIRDSEIPFANVLVSTLFEPAATVGGDWIGIYPHKDAGHLHFFVGDVTGHGIDSAFITSLMSGAIDVLEEGFRPGIAPDAHLVRVASSLNLLIARSPAGKCATMIMGSLDIKTGNVILLSAGHPPVIWARTPGPQRPVVPSGVLGLDKDAAFFTSEFSFAPGSVLCLFTDGLLENPGSPSGAQRHLRKALASLVESEPQVGVSADENKGWAFGMHEASRALGGENYCQHDDVAVMTIQWLGPCSPSPSV